MATLYDLTVGKIAWPVRFIAHSSPDKATLTLRNLTPGGPVLNIIGSTGVATFSLNEHGITQLQVGGWIDFAYQTSSLSVPPPGIGSNLTRMYSRGGVIYIKSESLPEQSLPFGPPPGPSWSVPYWMSGG